MTVADPSRAPSEGALAVLPTLLVAVAIVMHGNRAVAA